MKNKSKRSIKQNASLILRGLKLYASYPKPALLSRVLMTIVNMTFPFVNIYLSVLIVNELAGDKNKERLITLVTLTLGLNLVLWLIKSVITEWSNYCCWDIWRVPHKALTDKLLTMDYIDLENSKIQQDYFNVREDMSNMGFGLPRLYNNYDIIIGGVVQIVISVAMAISLFTLKIPEDSTFTWLDSPFALVIVLLSLCLSMFLSPYIITTGGKVWEKAAKENYKYNRIFRYYLFGMMENQRGADIRIYNQKKLIDKGVSYLNNNTWIKYSIHVGVFNVLSTGINGLSNGLIYLFIVLKSFSGAFGVGSIVQYVNAVTQFGNGFASVFKGMGELINNNDFLEKTFHFLDIPNKKYQGTLSVEKRNDNEYEIEFQNVSFKYPFANEYALENVNLKFKIGTRLAVVGMNGSGKTTMIKLLCRLYDPNEGIITLNGLDIKKYNYDEYMGLFGVVFQDFKLLPFTLGQNVAASVEYKENEVIQSLEKVGFKQRLDSMPNGLDTYLYKNAEGNGVEISGGEGQKIALARALYKNAPFIILDEPTATLDPIAEYEIYSKFNEIVGGKTAVYISHRLSSCRFCDDIVVFHGGKMVQRGSHDVLIEEVKGKYYELWNAQAQYYKTEVC